jgi:(p)ppGpp synthase/HD superfamily hydrolase
MTNWFEEKYKRHISNAKEIYKNPEHYINTAKMLFEHNADTPTILAAFYHGVKSDELRDKLHHFIPNFEINKEVSDVLHHLSYIKENEKNEFQANLKEIRHDPRPFLLRAMDQYERLLNSKTDKSTKEKTGEKIMNIYSLLIKPFSYTLGRDMEENAFKITKPGELRRIEKYIKDNGLENQKILLEKKLDNTINENNILAIIESDIKKPYRIYTKEKKIRDEKGLKSHDRMKEKKVRDFIRFRIIVENLDDVKRVEEIVKKMMNPDTITVKDYIQEPKGNGYQSLHIIGESAIGKQKDFEVQIRTEDMHKKIEDDEKTSHASYETSKMKGYSEPMKFYNYVVNEKNEKESRELINDYINHNLINVNVKINNHNFNVQLPEKSIALEPAFKIPRKPFKDRLKYNVGHYISNIFINKKHSKKDAILNNGDSIEFKLSKIQKHSPDLKRFVKTREARYGLEENQKIFSRGINILS